MKYINVSSKRAIKFDAVFGCLDLTPMKFKLLHFASKTTGVRRKLCDQLWYVKND